MILLVESFEYIHIFLPICYIVILKYLKFNMNYSETITILYWYSLIEANILTTNLDTIAIKNNNTIHPPLSTSRSLADRASTIKDLEQMVRSFDQCSLKKMATNTVFSDGTRTAKIVLIGEAPGATEDAQGIPFCGESGELLDNMLYSIGLSRKQNVYITNTIFWRPPANRRPTNEEIEVCKPFVEKHIALMQPKLLILVGSTAAASILGNNIQISKIRQQYFEYKNQYIDTPIPTTTIFHPAYLLRQSIQKKTTWYDLLKIKQFCQKEGILPL